VSLGCYSAPSVVFERLLQSRAGQAGSARRRGAMSVLVTRWRAASVRGGWRAGRRDAAGPRRSSPP